MNIFLKRFFLFIVCILSLNIQAISMDDNIDEGNIGHAVKIANNILNKKLEKGVDDIMKDHSENAHSSGDSYFTTNDRGKMKTLILLVASTPDKHAFYRVGPNYRLAISKKISEQKALEIFGRKNIGYDEKFSAERFRIVLCFGINGMTKLSDSKNTGAFLTGFPAREDYKLSPY
jgi:hypothetical protein